MFSQRRSGTEKGGDVHYTAAAFVWVRLLGTALGTALATRCSKSIFDA